MEGVDASSISKSVGKTEGSGGESEFKGGRARRRVGCTERGREGGLGSNDEIPAMYHIPWPGSQVVHLCRTSCAPVAFISTNALIRTLLLRRRSKSIQLSRGTLRKI